MYIQLLLTTNPFIVNEKNNCPLKSYKPPKKIILS